MWHSAGTQVGYRGNMNGAQTEIMSTLDQIISTPSMTYLMQSTPEHKPLCRCTPMCTDKGHGKEEGESSAGLGAISAPKR
jgi:hypothetical protein